MIVSWYLVACYLGFAAILLVHLKRLPPGAPWCARLGFAIAFGGSLGKALALRWPSFDQFHVIEATLATGLVLLAARYIVESRAE